MSNLTQRRAIMIETDLTASEVHRSSVHVFPARSEMPRRAALFVRETSLIDMDIGARERSLWESWERYEE